MKASIRLSVAIAGAIIAIASAASAEPIVIKPLYSGATQDLSGKYMTVLEATLEPGAGMPPHRHPGTVYAYVVSGSIRSKISTDEAAVVYTSGQGWVEAPGIIHEIFENPSDGENAVVAATFIHRKGEELVLPVK